MAQFTDQAKHSIPSVTGKVNCNFLHTLLISFVKIEEFGSNALLPQHTASQFHLALWMAKWMRDWRSYKPADKEIIMKLGSPDFGALLVPDITFHIHNHRYKFMCR